jgi:hypothetical protein
MFTTRALLALACGSTLAACGSTPPPTPSSIPVLRYASVDDERAFARQMLALDRAGYRTISLDQLDRFVRGERVRLPRRPLVLTFDEARASTSRHADWVLRELGLRAVLFVGVGRVNAGERDALSWTDLDALQSSGRWDVQLRAGTGSHLMQWGPERGDVGPFYAYRGTEEVLGGWRERVFGDISWAERQLEWRIDGYRPLAFAPPYGNYGQVGTNDPRIPRTLLPRLLRSFPLVFTHDRPGLALRGAPGRPVGRTEVTTSMPPERLLELVRTGQSDGVDLPKTMSALTVGIPPVWRPS